MSEMTGESRDELDRFLRELRRALSSIPNEDRDEIVRETESHLLDRVAGGSSAAAATGELGDPATYGRRFVENYRIDSALESGSAWRMLRTAGSLLGRGVSAFLGFPLFLSLYITAFAFIVIAVAKPFAPEAIGFWTAPGVFHFSYIPDPSPEHVEHLGWSLVPLGLGIGGFLWWGTTRMLRAFLSMLRGGS